MKKGKKYLALAAAAVLVIVALLPMVFAFGSGEKAEAMFRGSFAAAVLLPVILFGILLVAKLMKKKMTGKEKKIDTIIFDVGRVLVGFDWESFLDRYGYTGEKRARIAKAVFQSDAWNLRDRGTVSDEEILQMFIAGSPEDEKDIRKIFGKLEETISRKDYAKTWVRYLKNQGYKLYILSNYAEGILKKTKDMIPIKEMDGAVFSCDVHALKPEPEIYDYLLNTYGITPEKAVFIDDRKENLEGAEKFGIHTVLFQDFKQAAAELRELGIE